jgi:hypothetical protein
MSLSRFKKSIDKKERELENKYKDVTKKTVSMIASGKKIVFIKEPPAYT